MADADIGAWSFADLGIGGSFAIGTSFTVNAAASFDVINVDEGVGTLDDFPQPDDFTQVVNGTLDGVPYAPNTVFQAEAAFTVTDGTDTFVIYWFNTGPGTDGTDGTNFTHTQGFFGVIGNDPLVAGTTYTITGNDISVNFAATAVGMPEAEAGIADFFLCFTAPTNILCESGLVPIEDLSVGDLVQTMDSGLQPIRWIGSSRRPATGNFAPILISKGALGNTRDLKVSPQHRMLISSWRVELLFGENEVLAPAKALINDTTIRRVEGGEVEYFHTGLCS